MSFTDQKPHIATEETCQAPWGGHRDGSHFRCCLCGHRFKPGDTYRWQCGSGHTYEFEGRTYGTRNFLVCQSCDGDDVIGRWIEQLKDWMRRFWWSHDF